MAPYSNGTRHIAINCRLCKWKMTQKPIYLPICLIIFLSACSGNDGNAHNPTANSTPPEDKASRTSQEVEMGVTNNGLTPQPPPLADTQAEATAINRNKSVITIGNRSSKDAPAMRTASTSSLPTPISQTTLGQLEEFARLTAVSMLDSPTTRPDPPSEARLKQTILHQLAEMEIIRSEAEILGLTPTTQEQTKAMELARIFAGKTERFGLGTVSQDGITNFASLQTYRRLLSKHLTDSLPPEQQWIWYVHRSNRVGVTAAMVFNGATSREIDQYVIKNPERIKAHHQANRARYRMPAMKRVVLVTTLDQSCQPTHGATLAGKGGSSTTSPTQADLNNAIEKWLQEYLSGKTGNGGTAPSDDTSSSASVAQSATATADTTTTTTMATILGKPFNVETRMVTRNVLPEAWRVTQERKPVRLSRDKVPFLPPVGEQCQLPEVFMGVEASIPARNRELDASLMREIAAELCVTDEKNHSAQSQLNRARKILAANGDLTLIKKLGLQLKSIDPFMEGMVIPSIGYAPDAVTAIFHAADQDSKGGVVGPFKIDQHLAVFRIEKVEKPDRAKFEKLKDQLPGMILEQDGPTILSDWLREIYSKKSINIDYETIDQSGIIQHIQEQMTQWGQKAAQTRP